MAPASSLITYSRARPLGLGRITSLASSTHLLPGFLFGCGKGLFFLSDFDSKPEKIRKFPVGWIISGSDGVVLYEVAEKKGRIVILDIFLNERKVDAALARTLYPKAVLQDKILLYRQEHFLLWDIDTEDLSEICEIRPTRLVGPVLKTGNNYEFIVIHRDIGSQCLLYQLVPAGEDSLAWGLNCVSELEDPVSPKHFHLLPDGDYLVVHGNRAVFWTFRIYTGDNPGLRPSSMIPIKANAYPSGIVVERSDIYASSMDTLIHFIYQPGEPSPLV